MIVNKVNNRGQREEEHRINERIRVPEVRLVDSEGNQVGVVTTKEALERAREVGLDLVEFSPNAKPPVCKIVDYGKFRFDQKKKLREQKKKQKVIHVKEIKFRPKIDKHDYDFKVQRIKTFIEHGDKVKVTMMFRGREIVHSEIGMDIMKKVVVDLEGFISIEKEPKQEGRNITMVFAPVK
jgi:translation initiation factor IF-3